MFFAIFGVFSRETFFVGNDVQDASNKTADQASMALCTKIPFFQFHLGIYFRALTFGAFFLKKVQKFFSDIYDDILRYIFINPKKIRKEKKHWSIS